MDAKIDQTTTLASDLSTEKKSITANFDNQINFIKTNPEKFKPGADGVWNVGRLSKNQLSQIATLESEKIKALDKATNENNGYKSDNQTSKKVEYQKYYKFVALIMILQLFANIFLMFSYSRIYIENNRADATKEKLLNQQNTIQGGIENFILGTVNSMQAAILNNLRVPFDYANRTQKALPTNEVDIPFQEVSEKNKSAGFLSIKKQYDNNMATTPAVTPAVETIQITPNLNSGGFTPTPTLDIVSQTKAILKNCIYCGKPIPIGKYPTAKHCNDQCKIKAWELKNGREFTKKASK